MKKALFIINSISNGGAERVAINMANELVTQGFVVDFILLGTMENNNYKSNPKINFYPLNLMSENKIKKLFKLILGVRRVNDVIRKNGNNYMLITSHLPMSNIVTRLSCVGKNAIYVFHTKVCNYRILNDRLYGVVLRRFFKKRKIATVSNGVRMEAINRYHMDGSYIKTIYNPINIKEIMELSKEKIFINEPYFLCVGRFNDAKRQDRIVEIFYYGKFYKEYKLVFCGIGENEEKIKELVKNLKIEDRVLFLGWQKNVYKYINGAKLLISASDYEAFPMNLVEAFACNTMVVSGDCEFGPSEIMLGEHAKYLAKKDDVNDYIEKIRSRISHRKMEKNKILSQCLAKTCIDKYINFARAKNCKEIQRDILWMTK